MLLVMIWSSASALLGGPASLVRTKNTGDEHLQACLTRLALPQGLLALAAFVGYHVQIINRLSSGYPLWYWYIASHILSESKLPRSPSTPLGQSIIVRGMAMYGLIQAALFGSFLPPA
jgi:Gpi18-like mannosyltransferase